MLSAPVSSPVLQAASAWDEANLRPVVRGGLALASPPEFAGAVWTLADSQVIQVIKVRGKVEHGGSVQAGEGGVDLAHNLRHAE